MTDRAEQFEDLLADLADGTLTESQRAELFDLLQNHPAFRGRYVEFTLLHADLVWDRARTQDAERVQGPEFRVQDKKSAIHNPQSAIIFALAAALAIAVTAWFLLLPEPRTPNPEPATAMLTDLSPDAVFADGQAAPPLGGELAAGPIRLIAGKLQLMFKSTAVVDLFGPCEFEMTGSNRGRLLSGRLEAFCPKRAHGFTIDLPGAARLVDLGTAFRVRVDPDSESLFRVTEGRVRLEMPDGQAAVLTPNQGAVITPQSWGLLQTIAALDVNNVETPSPTAEGFTALPAADGQSVRIGEGRCTLFGGVEGRDRGEAADDLNRDFAFHYPERDGTFVGLRLQGLEAGVYDIRSWHYDRDFDTKPARISIRLRAADGSETILADHDLRSTDPAEYRIAVESGKVYELIFREDNTSNRTRFNAIQIERYQPMSSPPSAAGLGNESGNSRSQGD